MRGAICVAVVLVLYGIANAEPNAEFAARIEAGRSFWSFQPVRSAAVPQTDSAWVRTDIDAFVLRKLAEKGLAPSPELDRIRLLRRVTLDLTGLPPTPEQARAFLDDESPRAYERLVDRLLASPHYGERWALKWLDVVRYSDTDGFELDAERRHAWRYRDYVVRAFNQDKPYTRFVQEQVAGDELFPQSLNALLATGFLGAGPRHVVGGNQDKDEARQEVLNEMTIGTGTAFLGLTVGCARCHDHKFDPISQADYYELQAFFSATAIDEPLISSTEQLAVHKTALAEHNAKLRPIRKQLEQIEKPYRELAREKKRENLAPEFVRALSIDKEQRTEEQARLANEAEDQIKPMWYETVALIPPDVAEERRQLRQRMHAINLFAPKPAPAAYGVENQREAPQTHVLKIGDHRHKLEPVEPAFLSVLPEYGLTIPEGPKRRRAALARWLTAAENPLLARVMVNRIWEFRMGSGLVRDPNNFGLLGGPPSHPELLDYLADRFAAFEYSVKAIDRMIVLSAVYRQASAIDPAKAEADADNQFYWRANRRRLEGEAIRDNILAVAGNLNPALGGPPVRVPIAQEVYDLIFTEGEPDNLWPVTPDPEQHVRRSLYLLNKRTVRLPFLNNFDQPDTMTSCARRSTSTHALQALTMLNSPFLQTQSRVFAERLLSECGPAVDCQINRSYRLALAREPSREEFSMAKEFLDGQTPLEDFCLTMLNRNEFVYRP